MPENPRSEDDTAADERRGIAWRDREAAPGVLPRPVLVVRGCRCGSRLAVAVTALELGAIVPGLSLFSAIGSFVIPVLAPLLVVAALPAIGLGLGRRRRGPRRTATAAAEPASRAR